MESIYKFYIENKNNKSTSFDSPLGRYVQNNVLPRIKNIDAVNKPREFAKYNLEPFLKSSKNYYIPGFVYTWKYKAQKSSDDLLTISSVDNPNKQIKISEAQLKGSPIVLCLNVDAENVLGLDLTVFPPEVSCILLDCMISIDKNYFENLNYESWKENGNYLPTKIIKYFSQQGSINAFCTRAKMLWKVDLFSSIRKYKKTSIQNPQLIEFWSWKYVPFQIDRFYKDKQNLII